MKQIFKEDDDGNTAIEMDEEGIEFLIIGLENLLEDGPGGLRTSPAVWTEYPSKWKFWKKPYPVVGEVRLRYVE